MKQARSISGLVAAVTLAFVLAFAGVRVSAQTVPDNAGTPASGLPEALRNVGFEPPLNGQIPLALHFKDETGRDVALGDFFHGKPVLLALVYYGCPMLCNQVEQGVVGSLKMLSFNPGTDYDVVFVSFDSRESSDMAAQALFSHFFGRSRKSFRTSPIRSGEPKWILAVSYPIASANLSSSRSAGSCASSIREQSGARRRTSQIPCTDTVGS